MQTLGIILIILGVVSLILGIILWITKDAFLCFLLGVLFFVVFDMYGAALVSSSRTFVAEYPTSKYELSYKYVMQDNATDTIIVIKEKEK